MSSLIIPFNVISKPVNFSFLNTCHISQRCRNSEISRFLACDFQDRRKFRTHCTAWIHPVVPTSSSKSSGNFLLGIRPYAAIPEVQEKILEKSEPVDIKLTLPQRFVQSCPKNVQPYLRLSRIDQPIGTWLLFWPATWGLTAATGGLPDLKLLALYGAGAFIMRGAGCTVNDMFDKDIDPRVQRTSTRPLAAREISMKHAAGWLGGQLSIALGILLLLNPSCFLISCGAMGLVCLYPLAKRVTYWPQAVLGLTFNTGILIGYAGAHSTQVGLFDVPYLDPACLSLYMSGVLWTLIYDTIYAHQDIKDDTLLGLGSTARRFGDNTKLWLTGFSCLMMSNLAMTGVLADLAWPYYLGLGGVAAHLMWQIQTLNIKSAQNCAERFNSNSHIGWIITLSLLAAYWMKDKENSTKLSEVKRLIGDNLGRKENEF